MSLCKPVLPPLHPSPQPTNYVPVGDTGRTYIALMVMTSFRSRVSCREKSYLLSLQMILTCSPFLAGMNKERMSEAFPHTAQTRDVDGS